MCVHQALQNYLQIQKSLDLKHDEKLAQLASSVVRDASITKATGTLLQLFRDQKNLELLREQVQAELREFRSNGLRERECLPRPVVARADMALAMRKGK